MMKLVLWDERKMLVENPYPPPLGEGNFTSLEAGCCLRGIQPQEK
jgi:hypothetical protein